jgi:hypothetical protein
MFWTVFGVGLLACLVAFAGWLVWSIDYLGKGGIH